MAILNFQKPDKVVMIHSQDNEGRFEFRPLEQGYGLTVGNALRMYFCPLLKALPSPASVSKEWSMSLPPYRG